MRKPVAIYGGVLILIGILGYVLSGMVHATALIPAAFGVVALAFTLGPVHRSLPRGPLIAGVVIAILALFGTGSALAELPAALSGTADGAAEGSTAAVYARAATAIASIAMLIALGAGLLRGRRSADA